MSRRSSYSSQKEQEPAISTMADDEGASSSANEFPSVEENESLPVASKVETPPELLEHLHELEQAQQRAQKAIPLDLEEESLEEQVRRRKLYYALSFWIVALAIVGVLLGIFLGKAPNSSNETDQSPTPSPSTLEFASLQELIESVSPNGSSTESLNDPSSPQYAALTWLEGNANLDVYPDWKKIQRYALAVLYYSTNGDDWLQNDGWLSDEDECSWFTTAVPPLCDNETGAILKVLQSENNLIGTIPHELALLSDSLRKSIKRLSRFVRTR